jgi:hypothetical protein
MKTFCGLVITLFLVLDGISQPIVLPSHLPQPGQIIYEGEASSEDVTNFPSGPNQTWNFQDLVIDGPTQTQYLVPTGFTGSSRFPNATVGHKIALLGFYFEQFYKSSSVGFEYMGSYLSLQAGSNLAYTETQNPILIYPAGLAYGQSVTKTGQLVYLDSISPDTILKKISTIKQTFTSVGWGNLTTPYISNIPVQLVRRVSQMRDSVFKSTDGYSGPFVFDSFPEDQNDDSESFLFLQAGSPALLLEARNVVGDEGGDYTLFNVYSNQNQTTVSPQTENGRVHLSPNPNRNQTLWIGPFPGEAKGFVISNVMGKKVYEQKLESQEKVPFEGQHLPKGVYFLEILGAQGPLPGKTQRIVFEP